MSSDSDVVIKAAYQGLQDQKSYVGRTRDLWRVQAEYSELEPPKLSPGQSVSSKSTSETFGIYVSRVDILELTLF